MTETNMEMTSSVLSFLAENVNLYNWYLLRGPNPNRYMYDETEEAMSKLYYKLFERAEENNEVKQKLKNTVLKLCLTDDEEEDNNNSARLLAHFVQNRQRDLHLHNHHHPESERALWLLYNSSYYVNDLYSKLYKLERIYMDILCHDDTELRKISYNHIVEAEDNLPQYRVSPPELGASLELELENVYLSDHMGYAENDIRYNEDEERYYEEDLRYYEEERDEDYEDQREEQRERYYEQYMTENDDEGTEDDEDNNNTNSLKIVDTNIIMEFDCPICFEEQTSGSHCVTTTCEHQYCMPCFESMTQRKAVCAMCRGKITEYIVSIVV
jgi:hypothetical protein